MMLRADHFMQNTLLDSRSSRSRSNMKAFHTEEAFFDDGNAQEKDAVDDDI
jgi:hypothetical protein